MIEFLNQGYHITPQCNVGFLGTPFTASIDAMEEHSQSRKDDLESLGYNLMFLIN